MLLAFFSERMWGQKARFSYLGLASILLLLTMLGARELWTQEHRWADIVAEMFIRHDYLHPYLGQNNYYDKPLLSYWLIVLITKITGSFTTWSLRLPSALSGLLAIWSTYRLGLLLKNKQLGLLSAWLLLTTFYFVFWARTSSADMLNLAGSLLAVTWYFEKKDKPNFFNYFIFFMIVAVTSLCKGLVGAVIPFIAIITNLYIEKTFTRHLRLSLLLASIPAIIVYLLPFWASSHFGSDSYSQSGLYLVYRENILRYFQPFDHVGPIYTYFIYLPVYLFPWSIFFVFAVIAQLMYGNKEDRCERWITYSLFLIFLFFTFSGSRRSYYVLPMIPFAILFTSHWLLRIFSNPQIFVRLRIYFPAFVVLSFLCLFVLFDIMQPWYYSRFGMARFSQTLKEEAIKIQPWENWKIVMLDAESKLSFYLKVPAGSKNYDVEGMRDKQSNTSLIQAWPILKNKPKNTIFITRKRYVTLIRNCFDGYQLIEMPKKLGIAILDSSDLESPAAFMPLEIQSLE